MTYTDLEDFITCYNPDNRHVRKETWSEENPDGRWRKFIVGGKNDQILNRDKTSLHMQMSWVLARSMYQQARIIFLRMT